MKNKIIIDFTPEQISMAVIMNDCLTEYSIERNNNEHIVGSIFKGRVKNVLKGIQAAFIDIGYEKNVFFYNSDDISLTQGQTILVQIAKDAMGSKGPRATNQISLAGRYVVFLPQENYVGISKNIKDEQEKNRLKEMANELKPQNGGLIVRTVACNCTKEELKKDIQYLVGLWQSIKAREKICSTPCLLYKEADLPIRIVRDYLSEQIDEIIINDEQIQQRMQQLIELSYPSYQGKIIYYKQKDDIFSYYGLTNQMENINSRRVSIPCGGYIVFDHTEALSVIDINTGSYKGGDNIEDTAFLTNSQAVEEIARQLRLRDIGGIIIIDFIDMQKEENKKRILEKLELALTGDKMKPRVLGITKLGLVEMTRKKSRQNSAGAHFSQCIMCDGSGFIKSPEAVSVEVRRCIRQATSKKLLLQAHPSIIQWFFNHEMKQLPTDKQVKLQTVDTMHPNVFNLLDMSL